MHAAADSWTDFYTDTLTFAATVVAVLGAAIGFAGVRIRAVRKKVLLYGVFASLSEVMVAAFVSISRMLPSVPLARVVDVAVVSVAVGFSLFHAVFAVEMSRRQRRPNRPVKHPVVTTYEAAELWMNLFPFSAYFLILWGAFSHDHEILIGIGVTWLIGSGLFQSVRYLALRR